MASSSADRLARWTKLRDTPAGSAPQTTPSAGRPPLAPFGGVRGDGKAPDGSLRSKGGSTYASRLTDQQRDQLAALVSELHRLAPVTAAHAARRPYAWARQTGMHHRFGALLALDWRELRRPRPDSLERLAIALGLTADTAAQLARTYPHAVATDPQEAS